MPPGAQGLLRRAATATISSSAARCCTLPPGQGFSIYSLAAVLPLLAAKQRPTHPNDWMTTDAEIACPDPNCRQPPAHHPHRHCGRFRHSETTASAAEGARMTSETRELAPGLRHLPRHPGGWQLAGGHGAIDRAGGVADMVAAIRRRHHDLRLRRHLHRRRGALSAPSRASAHRARRRRGARQRSTPNSCPISTCLPASTRADVERIIDRSLRAARRRPARPRAVPLVGLRRCRWLRGAALARRIADATGKIDLIGGTNFDTAHAAAHARRRASRSPRMQVQYSAARPAAGERPGRRSAAAHGIALLCYGTVAGGFLSERWLGAAEPHGAARQPLADQIQAHHRRFRRLGAVPGAAARAAARRATGTAPTSPRSPAAACSTVPASPPSSSARATRSISPRKCGCASCALTPHDRAAIDAVLARARVRSRRRLCAGARPQRAARPRS